MNCVGAASCFLPLHLRIRRQGAMSAPATSGYQIIDHSYDDVVVGAGGSGIRRDGRGGRTGCS